jgi:hypothetical protein
VSQLSVPHPSLRNDRILSSKSNFIDIEYVSFAIVSLVDVGEPSYVSGDHMPDVSHSDVSQDNMPLDIPVRWDQTVGLHAQISTIANFVGFVALEELAPRKVPQRAGSHNQTESGNREGRRQLTLEALVSQIEALTRQNPVLMIFEGAHWTDPTTLELFGRVVDRVRSLRVLLIVTFRPDFDPPWVGRAYVTFLAINRLGEREILAMIEGVIGNKALPANVRQDTIERTDGIPLFVEEITKAVLEAESQGAVEHLASAVPSSHRLSLQLCKHP